MAIASQASFTEKGWPETPVQTTQNTYMIHADRRRNLVANLNQTPPRTASGANELCMPTCEVCENDYDKAFEVVVGGERHIFDSFECAIHALAPVCPHCNCRIVGHGVEADGQIFCCVHCARASGTTQLKDRV
jgi:hypothetical protein